jgi:hypothetical protein
LNYSIYRYITFIIFIFIFYIINTPTANADITHKPSLTITITNVEDEILSIDLIDENGKSHLEINNTEDDFIDFWGTFISEGYKEKNNKVKYYVHSGVPRYFKVHLTLSNNKVIETNYISTRNFNSEVVVNAQNGKIKEKHSIPINIPLLLIIICATIIIELMIASIFKIKETMPIFYANITTQLILHTTIISFFLLASSYVMLLAIPLIFMILECIIPFVEYKIYRSRIKSVNRRKLFTYTIVANVVTFFLSIPSPIFLLKLFL